jgi:hypothetical protein
MPEAASWAVLDDIADVARPGSLHELDCVTIAQEAAREAAAMRGGGA